MLPTAAPSLQPRRSSSFSANSLTTYLRRIIKPKQMDIEYAFWLMLQLCTSPRTAYRHTAYNKQTKNQWARDDPAFVVVTSAFVAIAAVAYCITFGDTLWHSFLTILSAVLIDYLLIGFAVATACWLISNKFLRKKLAPHQIEQHVEWLYAFDVHCNAYFPLFLLLYILQFLLSPLLLLHSFLANALACALYAAALAYYHYMNFLGYSSLPFLEHTEVFLWPIGAIFLCIPFATLAGFNPCRFTLGIYFG